MARLRFLYKCIAAVIFGIALLTPDGAAAAQLMVSPLTVQFGALAIGKTKPRRRNEGCHAQGFLQRHADALHQQRDRPVHG